MNHSFTALNPNHLTLQDIIDMTHALAYDGNTVPVVLRSAWYDPNTDKHEAQSLTMKIEFRAHYIEDEDREYLIPTLVASDTLGEIMGQQLDGLEYRSASFSEIVYKVVNNFFFMLM